MKTTTKPLGMQWRQPRLGAITMRLQSLSRLLRTRGADWSVALLGAIGSGGLLVLAAWQRSPGRFGPSHADVTLPVIIGAICGVCAFLGVRSWRRLWRSGRTPRERSAYDLGVRRIGITMVAASPLIGVFVILALGADTRSPGTWTLLVCVAFMALSVALPLGLWGGYLLGYARAGAIGPAHDAEREATHDLPPTV